MKIYDKLSLFLNFSFGSFFMAICPYKNINFSYPLSCFSSFRISYLKPTCLLISFISNTFNNNTIKKVTAIDELLVIQINLVFKIFYWFKIFSVVNKNVNFIFYFISLFEIFHIFKFLYLCNFLIMPKTSLWYISNQLVVWNQSMVFL